MRCHFKYNTAPMKHTNLCSLAAFLFLSFPLTAGYAEGQVLDRVVAVVNDDAITQSELDAYLRPLYEQMKKELQGAALSEQLEDARNKLLNQVIEDRLVYQKAKEMKIEIKEAELDREMNSFKKKFKDAAEFESAMQQGGFRLSAVKERLERQIMIRRLHDMQVRSRVIVTPTEVETFYKEHAADFTERTRVQTRSITMKKNDQAREKGLTDEETLRRMKEIRKKIIASPERFAELATKNSEDYQATQGGLGDWVEPGSMIPVIDQVIFNLKKGEVSDIIESPMGYHLFRLEDRSEGKDRKFEEVRDEIYDRLYREKAKVRFEHWMEELKREAYISLRN